IVEPGKEYYALKNAGFREALGNIVIFTDSDCRLGDNYVARVLELFNNHPEISCAFGRTYYDGKGFLTTLNTVLSFGCLHDPAVKSAEQVAILSHNVVIRAADASDTPFGPYIARVEGDAWLTEWYRSRGQTPILDRDLVVYHEDSSYSLKLRLDRQLREILYFLRSQEELRPWRKGAWVALSKALTSVWWRSQKLVRYGRHLDMGAASITLALPVVLVYAILDIISVSLMIAVPALGNRWFRYQNGDLIA
ncbi:glycosyltransferase family A protein, partial [Methylomagnum sp.]